MAGSDKEYEAANLLLPTQNTSKLRVQLDRLASPTTQAFGLPTFFGNWSQHYYSVQADGGKIYFALSQSPTGTIDPAAMSTATGVNLGTATGVTANAVAVADGSTEHGTVLGGRAAGITGTTATLFNQNQFILYRTASGVGSAIVRIRRSSIGPDSGMQEFYPAGWQGGRG